MSNTLLVRYHRIGDAVIVLPLIAALAEKYPNDTFTVISNSRFKIFFDCMTSNVVFLPMVAKSRSGLLRGVSYGVRKLFFTMKVNNMLQHIDKIAFFQMDSFERKLCKLANKKEIQAPVVDYSAISSQERLKNKCNDGLTIMDFHKKVLTDLGYIDVNPHFDASAIKRADTLPLLQRLNINSTKKLIGIAPFSKEISKIYPHDRMKEIIENLCQNTDIQLLVFGGGAAEEAIVNQWKEEYPQIISLIDCVSFEQEACIIAKCVCMLTMDSANLHISRLLSVPTVSVWGSTLPENGYVNSHDNDDTRLVRHLSCQPCSLFGKLRCVNEKQYDCLNIDAKLVTEAILKVVYGK